MKNWFNTNLLPVTTISRDDYQALVDSAELLVADSYAPKVMQLLSGNMLKFFRRKRLISSAMFKPYAVRFANNAITLNNLGIPSVRPQRILHCPECKMHIVEYEPVSGNLLRTLLQSADSKGLIEKTAEFIALLHYRGVYFRSLHFENIVWDGNRMGLIDVADMKIYKKPLSAKLRQRNHQHYLRYAQDRSIIEAFGLDRFMNRYQQEFDRLVTGSPEQ